MAHAGDRPLALEGLAGAPQRRVARPLRARRDRGTLSRSIAGHGLPRCETRMVAMRQTAAGRTGLREIGPAFRPRSRTAARRGEVGGAANCGAARCRARLARCAASRRPDATSPPRGTDGPPARSLRRPCNRRVPRRREIKTGVRSSAHRRSLLGETTSEANLLAADVRASNRVGPVCRCTITGVKPCSLRHSRFASRTDRLRPRNPSAAGSRPKQQRDHQPRWLSLVEG